MAPIDSSNNRQHLHVAMFPWLAFGHIIPFLQLSKFIAEKGHKVSFLSTTRNIKRLPALPFHLSPLINLVSLELPRVQELPENAEATMDVRTEDIQYLKKAYDGLKPQVTQFFDKESPDWIIYDFASYWVPEVAGNLGVSRGYFQIINAWFSAFFGSPKDLIDSSDERKTLEDFLTPPKWIPFPSNLCYRKHEAAWMLGSGLANASGVSDTYRSRMILEGSDCMFVRYCYEFEPQWLTLLQELYHLPVVPIGLMPPEAPTKVGDEKDDTWMDIKKWLDGHQKGHVVYVALGSEVMVNKSELGELALGLELSGLPFFWALRKPAGSTESDSVELLPDGFLERTRNRGMVRTSWVPQLQILSHESVGGFLTHCGWGSIVEGLMFGHPLIMLPFLVDQGLNARILVDKKVGIEVPRNDEDGSFTKDLVAKSLTTVVGDEEKNYKANAMALSKTFGDTKLQRKYIDSFIDYLEKQRRMLLSTIEQ
ncbi:putative soyasaponin III rhamnosyltransferase [Tanacetum coccineum]